jgi:hypothetical protein
VADDLVSWLLEQVTADEQIARAVLGDYAQHQRHWDVSSTGVVELRDPGLEGALVTGDGPVAWHIATWDPARVLAECNAKRRIVERYAFLLEHGDSGDARWVLPLLAEPYADRPGYQENWRP